MGAAGICLLLLGNGCATTGMPAATGSDPNGASRSALVEGVHPDPSFSKELDVPAQGGRRVPAVQPTQPGDPDMTLPAEREQDMAAPSSLELSAGHPVGPADPAGRWLRPRSMMAGAAMAAMMLVMMLL
jgi:hypothetical protein